MSSLDPKAILDSFRSDLAGAKTLDALEEVRRRHSGKKSPLKQALIALRDVPADERPRVAAEINKAQGVIDGELTDAVAAAEAQALAARFAAEWLDLTLPGLAPVRGARHPVTDVEDRCMSVLRRLGFELADGPEVEHPYYNFDALNVPEHHPARDLQDTFWVDGHYLLRSHTTTVQARVLEARPKLPVRIATMGRVYRNEAVDATHLAMFHQMEGIWVDRGLTFSDLKGTLAFLVRELYGDSPIRFKPKFYPYTEPSIGVDLECGACRGSRRREGASCEACHGAGWVTILGAGMVHPNVFLEFGFDAEEVSGIAFGLGTTRMASQHAGVRKVRTLYEQDVRYLRAMHRGKR